MTEPRGPIDWANQQQAEREQAPVRHSADTITDNGLDQLYDELAMQTQWTATYKAAWHSAQARAIGRRDAIARAEQAEDLLRVAHDTSNQSEAERARAVQRAEQAEVERDKACTAFNKATLRLEDTEAALERVRAEADRIALDSPWGRTTAARIHAALDDPKEPTP